jgi:hypothetical protein
VNLRYLITEVHKSGRPCENVSPMLSTSGRRGILRLPVGEAAFGDCVGVPAGHRAPDWAGDDTLSRPDGRRYRLDAEDVQGTS